MDYSPKSAAKSLSAQDSRGVSTAKDTPAYVDRVPSPGMKYQPAAASKALKAEDKDCPAC